MTCKLCKERGKTWRGDDPQCAFENGVFRKDNWACATMAKLRDIAYEMEKAMRHDMSCGSFGFVPVDNDFAPDEYGDGGGYIAMYWYKDRGRTDLAEFIQAGTSEPLTETHATIAIKTYNEAVK